MPPRDDSPPVDSEAGDAAAAPPRSKGGAPGGDARPETDAGDVEFVLALEDGGELRLRPGQASAELDAFLRERGASTCVFLPLVWPDRLGKKRLGFLKPLDPEQQRKKLPEAEWLEGTLHTTGPGPARSVAGVLALDLRRYLGRLAVHNLGQSWFYWAAQGSPVEVHEGSPLDDDSEFEMSSMRNAAGLGLRDLSHSLTELDRVPALLKDMQRDLRALFGMTALLVGLAVLAVAGAFAVTPANTEPEGLVKLLGLLAHPVLLPSVALGLYLRSVLGASPDQAQRELTHDEAASGWRSTAPLFAAVWLVGLVVVSLLTLARLHLGGELTPVELVDDATRWAILVFWILTPITYGRDFGSTFSAAFEALFAAILAIIVMKLSLFVTNMITNLFWSLLGMFLPFEIPIPFQDFFSALAAIGAELFFFGLLCGYSWGKTREHFGRWATLPC